LHGWTENAKSDGWWIGFSEDDASIAEGARFI
jgi:hypothetical protein